MIKRLLREFFLISRSERRGLLVAAMMLFLTLVFRFIIVLLPSNSAVDDYAFIDEAYELLMLTKDCEEAGAGTSPVGENKPEVKKLHLTGFNPNEISEDKLLEMNIPRFVASNIVKFRKAGGYFYKPDDLLRIYGLDSSLFTRLKPYVMLPAENKIYQEMTKNDEMAGYDKQNLNNRKNFNGDENRNMEMAWTDRRVPRDTVTIDFRIELNTADSAALVRLPGIGPVYAARIIKYRNLLGGYTSLSQLNEVYGLESFAYNSIDSLVYINRQEVTLLNLNTAGYSELLRHPYLSKTNVAAIIAYREFAGKINSLDEVNQSLDLDSAGWERIRFYLDISENDTTSKNLLH